MDGNFEIQLLYKLRR